MSTPICRCRVLYLGSSVPQTTKDGLQGIQEPLRELYPDEGISRGIDSWLSVWSNGFLLENLDERQKRATKFYPIDSLHYCAAIRHVPVPNGNGKVVHKFLPLDSPFARVPCGINPPLFACMLRRTSGVKVLECHLFVCKKELAANALVKCSFQAYADNMLARKLETDSQLGCVYSPVKPRDEYDDLVSIYGSVSNSPYGNPIYSEVRKKSGFHSVRSTLRKTFMRSRPVMVPAVFYPSGYNTQPPPNEKKSKKKSLSKKNQMKNFGSINSQLWPQLPPRRRATPIYSFPPPPPSFAGCSSRPMSSCSTIKTSDEPYFLPSRPSSSADFYYDRYSNGTLQSQSQKKKRRKKSELEKYNTGICHKKGHLNERAFSHSIRQEQRSRSHSSLSTLVYNSKANSTTNLLDDDISQMVAEMNLSDDSSDGDNQSQHQYSTLTNKSRMYKRGEC